MASLGSARHLVVAQSMASSIATHWVDLQHKRYVGLTVIVSGGTPTGTFAVKAANRSDRSDEVDVPDTALATGAPTDPSASAPEQVIWLEAYTRWIGISYTSSAGTGTLDVYAFIKD